MRFLNFKIKDNKRDRRALIMLGIFLLLLFLGFMVRSSLDYRNDKKREEAAAKEPQSNKEKQERIAESEMLVHYIDKFLKENPNITYKKAYSKLVLSDPLNVQKPSKVKRILDFKFIRLNNKSEEPEVIINSKSGKYRLEIKNGNIFLINNKSKEKSQITFKEKDINAVFSPDETKMVFLREAPEKIFKIDIWLYDIKNDKKTELLKGKENDDYENYKRKESNKRAMIHDMTFLPDDNQNIYFMSRGWFTSDAIHRLNISTKELEFVTSGNSVKPIQSGKYKGNLLVSKHRYPNCARGAYDPYFVVSPKGKELLAVSSKEDFYKGDYFNTTQAQREDFKKDVEKFYNIEFSASDIKGVKRVVEKEKKEGERIYYNLSYPEFEGNESLSSVGSLSWFFGEACADFTRPVIRNNFFDGSLIYNDYEITFLTDSLVSIRFDFYFRRADKPYGKYEIKTFNFRPKLGDKKDIPIGYNYIFKSDSDYLSVLSDMVEKKLANILENKDKDYDKESIKKITNVCSNNFNNFYLSKKSLFIVFNPDEENMLDEVEIIEIPFDEIREYVDPEIKDVLGLS